MIFLKDTYLVSKEGRDLDVQGLISSAGCFLRIMNKDTRQIDLLCAVIYCYFPRITKIRTSTFPHFSSASLYIFFFHIQSLCCGSCHQAQRQFTVPLNTSLTVPSCVHQCHCEHDFITQFDSIQGSFPTFFMHRGLSSGRK